MRSLVLLGSAQSWGYLAIWLVVVFAIAALVYLFVQHSGLPIPSWVPQVVWLVALAAAVIIAIRFLMTV